jgi:hypothetical protein
VAVGKGALGQLAAYWPEDTARYAHVPLKRVGDLTLHEAAREGGDRPALVTASGPVSYGELSEQVKELAARFRARLQKGSRVALALSDARELTASLFACFETEMLAFASAGEIAPELLAVFSAELVIGRAPGAIGFAELLAGEANERADRPDFKKPLIAFPKPDRSGEVVHNHKTLGATAIAIGSFFMMDADTRVLLLEPPTDWLSLSLLLGTWQRGGTVFVGWGEAAAKTVDRVDYLVTSWDHAVSRFVDPPHEIPGVKIGAGAIIGVERVFSLSRRRRLARRLATPVLTVLGRSDLGPTIASHPTWFLDDSVGIPLPNVDTRPMNPADGTPLNIGWDAVESAEIGFKSSLAPAGGELMADGWLRSHLVGEIDPTGSYFLGR